MVCSCLPIRNHCIALLLVLLENILSLNLPSLYEFRVLVVKVSPITGYFPAFRIERLEILDVIMSVFEKSVSLRTVLIL